ncbi:hypothetical protein, partial [Chengkuizengella axinellae]
TLRKVYSENWTKKRGSVTKEFTGHTTDYFIDSVPVPKTKYKKKIEEIIDEDIFKLLTNPAYFNEQLDWKKRREVLLQVCGDVTDQEVISYNDQLIKLPSILGSRTIDEYKIMIQSQKKKLNEEIEMIPVRIDEAYRSIPDTNGLSFEFIEVKISEIKEQIKGNEEELYRIQSGGEIAVKEKRLREIESEQLGIKNKLQSGLMDQVKSQGDVVSQLNRTVNDARYDIQSMERSIENNKKLIQLKDDEIDGVRDHWHEVNKTEFEHQHDENCPTCGQALPEEDIKTAHEKALANFNLRKSEQLAEIRTKGKVLSDESIKLKDQNEELAKKIETQTKQLNQAELELEKEEQALKELQSNSYAFLLDPEYVQKQNEASQIQVEILQLQESKFETVDKVKSAIGELRKEVDQLEKEKAKFGQIETIEKRIQELKVQEEKLAGEYERLEHDLYLIEEFTRAKVNLLEQKINSKFKYAQFKLFEQQVNGGLNEICETLYKGVPYTGGLNNAARINVGLDIINTLSDHYGFTAPIFIDNAEAVTNFIDTNTQVIRLVVSANDKQLRVENELQREAV